MIRPARPEDLDALFGVEVACFPRNTWERAFLRWVLENPNASGLAWEEDGRLVGSVFVFLKGEVAQVMSVAVLPSHRRCGIGRRLMEEAESIARARGARAARLEVSTQNAAAISLYRGLGYRTDGVLPKFYTSGEDAFAMVKSLKQNA